MDLNAAERFSMLDPRRQTANDRAYAEGMSTYFGRSLGTDMDKLRNFAKYVPRQALSLFLAKHQLFQQLLTVQGHIIECGVYLGGGLMTWAQLSAIYEPVNHLRQIVGFDTFTGFVGLGDEDQGDNLACAVEGGLATHAFDDLQAGLDLYDLNRPVGHIPRTQLVVGDACKTMPAYLDSHRHTVVSMLYLDFDLYEPTKVALETFLPRMPKGAILAFDELNQAAWPGETLAVLDTVGLRNLRIQRLPTTPQLSYAILE
ncbi:MAG: class I SAM-dependent methyltransferase [Candidatus Sericytochromatia bacterium]|nr:class I SAM-dependent methyltransferase [Candidatus Sericytochromatia bacterium]